jgi:NAD-dependent SIR2 family protein deacetylase
MAGHKFEQGITEKGEIAGVRCTHCGIVAPFQDGKIPDELRTQECPECARAEAKTGGVDPAAVKDPAKLQ